MCEGHLFYRSGCNLTLLDALVTLLLINQCHIGALSKQGFEIGVAILLRWDLIVLRDLPTIAVEYVKENMRSEGIEHAHRHMVICDVLNDAMDHIPNQRLDVEHIEADSEVNPRVIVHQAAPASVQQLHLRVGKHDALELVVP